VPLLRNGDFLPVFERSPAERADPILQDFEAQLGATWFSGRIWRLDFAARFVHMIDTSLSATGATAPLGLLHNLHPRTVIRVADEALRASFDIAASLAEGNTPASVRATSFIPTAIFERWHHAHPQWPTRGFARGIRAITVPEVRLGKASFANVEFSTRPHDDVFQGDDVEAKLGANAYANRAVTLDYATARLAIGPPGTRA